MHVLGKVANNIIVKDDLRAEVTEALLPVHTKLNAIDAKSERALEETRLLNERLSVVERKSRLMLIALRILKARCRTCSLMDFEPVRM